MGSDKPLNPADLPPQIKHCQPFLLACFVPATGWLLQRGGGAERHLEKEPSLAGTGLCAVDILCAQRGSTWPGSTPCLRAELFPSEGEPGEPPGLLAVWMLGDRKGRVCPPQQSPRVHRSQDSKTPALVTALLLLSCMC